jgi:hypothetical protein
VELGLPGFLHSTHAAWLVPAMSPAMADLDLEGFGLDLHGTEVLFAKTSHCYGVGSPNRAEQDLMVSTTQKFSRCVP